MGVSLCFVILVGGSAHYDCKESLIRQGERASRRPQTALPQTAPLNLVPEIAIVLALSVPATCRDRSVFEMTQTNNRFFDEIGRLMNDAAGAAQGVKREVDAVVRNQAERILRDLDLVKREEFDAVKDMARLAREENEALKTRIAALEAKLGVSPSESGSAI
jgi:BMFP domain-containing protein YqiC